MNANSTPRSNRTKRPRRHSRRGSATIWGVLTAGTLLVTASLVIDGSMLYASHADLQAAADSSALAGASAMAIDPAEVRSRAIDYAAKNRAAGDPVVVYSDDVELGDWNDETKTFTKFVGSDEEMAAAVRVTAKLDTDRGNALRTAFAGMFGDGEIDMQATAIAIYQPRDIVLVLDLSGSMSDDSEIRNIPQLGREAVEANIEQIWHELGSPLYGNMTFETRYISSNSTSTVRGQLGLNNVPYPYPSGSWNDYISYVRNSSTLRYNGYKKDYGMITLINYWMERRPKASQTPDLWMTSQQPLTAVKDAVDVFIDFIQEEASEDWVGLSVYTASNGDAKLEHGLTDNLELIRNTSRQRQAAHYSGPTNIGAGMRVARQELTNNGRRETLKTMIVLTDGIANRPGSTSQARALVEAEAEYAADAGIAITTISLGANAQTDLMDHVAEVTRGVHFNVPGGQSVEQYEQPLRDVFHEIARQRPLRLVY